MVGVPAGDASEDAASSKAQSIPPIVTTDAVTLPDDKNELYEGTVRLNVHSHGSMGLVVNFVQHLREKPEFRLLRMANNRMGGVDVWLALRQPIPLQRALIEIEGVDEVSPTRGRDLSPDSEDAPLTVMLKAGDDATSGSAGTFPCVYCSEPLAPGTTVCPRCRKTQV